MARKPKNFMDYVPRRNKNFAGDEDKNGIVTVHIKWRGPYHKIATVLFHKPSESHIELDDVGSFIWRAIDGQKTVYDLSQMLEAQYPDMEQPVNRLVEFLKILHNNEFIVYNVPEK